MDMIPIDPKLFIMCRLCVEEVGMYQILPQVQHKIKFCFDIEVEAYDGLPQLICKKCNDFLTECFLKKTAFTEKQISLKTKFKVKNGSDDNTETTQQIVFSSNDECDQPVNSCLNTTSKARKRRSRLISSSSSSQEFDNKTPGSHVHKIKLTSRPQTPAWQTKYKKHFMCRLCQKRCKRKSSFIKHFRKHENLISRYRDVFNTYCTVKMNKVDSKPNLTGQSNVVVYSQVKIMSNESKMDYYILYSAKERIDGVANGLVEYNNAKISIGRDSNANSSDDDVFVKRTSRKRSRLLTRSSNETVVLEGDSSKSPLSSDGENEAILTEAIKSKPKVTECINIDDSSDSTSCKSTNMNLRNKGGTIKSIKAKHIDYKSINNIISVCRNKYLKKNETNENDVTKYSQLKRKILNMGRKVINKQRFNCTGLLRFTEYKNLDIRWIPKINSNKEATYVHIMPKSSGFNPCNSENSGWKKLPKNQTNELSAENLDNSPNIDQSQSSAVDILLPIVATESLNGNPKESQPSIVEPVDHPSVLYPTTINVESETNLRSKLLNANPVANPKQLPKKFTMTDTQFNPKTEEIQFEDTKESIQNNESNSIRLEVNVISDSNLCMPIITSTTSLAALKHSESNETTKTDNISTNNAGTDSEISIPRIKVKPVTELMSERVLKNLSQQQITSPNNGWNLNQNRNISMPLPNIANNMYGATMVKQDQINSPIVLQPVKLLEITPNPSSSVVPVEQESTPDSIREYVILHTAELPNTRTDSPFKYLKNLLQIHNIILLDTNENITKDFVCLIKFKVQYESGLQPVVLSLSIQCALNKFYVGVQYNSEQANTKIDITKLSANWQWQVLKKIYSEDVVNKVLKNAQKVSTIVYEYTKKLLCLLKSVEFRKQS